ncbi:MAG TPA: tRNA preQ1(34) S-adenosylmethionine ribosyltransferase-isomerase QueA [Thermodesulfobacteriota bacterium]|nr:tRNA preQ1(34) S-adenosylmethionine ribosyltransferase-isomerase QueA [Thermodesulfobacteriota bacterium]
MRIEEFDYHLPRSLIAQYPSPERGRTSLMILDRQTGRTEHQTFQDIVKHLRAGDLLVMNDTRVLPARLFGQKETGGRIEMLLIPSWNGSEGEWRALIRGAKKVKRGARIQFEPGIQGEILGVEDGKGRVRFSYPGDVRDILREIGHMPLPPYIKRDDEPLDRERYQTVFAQRDGSIAAPTAGLHFTHPLLQSLKENGVHTTMVTLHVGLGTFSQVKSRNVEDHPMEAEWAEISEETAKEIKATKARGGRVVSVGTTTTRALESFSDGSGGVRSGKGMTSLFIYPPYRFSVIDGLVTNFHLPKSTLIMMVSAFAGKEFLMKAYQEAVQNRYRFYSYGDAMLIL